MKISENRPFLHPLKTSENQRSSDVFRGCKNVRFPDVFKGYRNVTLSYIELIKEGTVIQKMDIFLQFMFSKSSFP